jgi:hypothetical protein
MQLTRQQQVIVDRFRGDYELQPPDVQSEIARAVSWAECNIGIVAVFSLVMGMALGGALMAFWLG